MLNKNFLTKTRWLVTIILLLSIGISNAWATDPTLSDLSFPTGNTKLIVDENFNSLSTTSATAKYNVENATAYGVFNKMYNNNTGNTYAIVNNANGFGDKSLSLTAGSGSPLIASITGLTFGNVGAWRIKTTKSSYNRMGIYSPSDNNNNTYASARVYIQNNAGAISIGSGSAWTTVKTVSADGVIDICVIYNKSGSSKTYGSSISISNNTAHVYVNGDCVMNGTSPKEFSISSSAFGTAVFRVMPNAGSGAKCYVDDVQVWNELPGAASSTKTLVFLISPFMSP